MTVEIQNLTVRYGSITAVDSFTVTIPDGAAGLLGRNGAGKSTILKTILGLIRAASGEARVMDIDAMRDPIGVRRVVGYMPEKDCYLPLLSGFEMVSLAAEITGLPRRHARQRAHEVLFYVDLGEQRYRPVSTYSTGMKQKAKLATALVHDPPLLFLDEPTNGLDPGGRREMLELIGDLVTAKGKSVILSSHILGDVERVCRNAVLIEKGQLRAAGTLEELTRFAERIYQLRVSGDAAGVERLLIGRGYRVNRSGEDGDMEVAVPEGEGPEGIFEEVARGGSHVRKLSAKRRTLEEVFVSAVGEA